MSRKLSAAEVEACARAAHETNRAFNSLMGDTSYKSWEQSPEWVRVSARTSIIGIAEHDMSPQQLHASWVSEKRAQGWVIGPDKDFDKKTHPCLIPYDELPEEHRIKDEMWIGTVKLMLGAIWRIPQ